MRKSNSVHLVAEQPGVESLSLQPKQPYIAAVHAISSQVDAVEAFFDEYGRLRTMTTDDPQGLFAERFSGSPEDFTTRFLFSEEIFKALGLRHAELVYNSCVDIPNLGKRVEFRQVITVAGESYPVRAGYVHVFIDEKGRVFQVNSTVRHGRKPLSLGKLITPAQAIAKAKLSIAVDSVEAERAELVFSSHNDRLDAVYEVTLTTHNPRKVVLILVRAANGQVVHKSNKLRTETKRSIRGQSDARRRRRRPRRPQPVASTVTGKSFLQIPDPNVAVLKQIHDVVLDMLPDPKVLKNHNCILYLGGGKNEVKAKADGTFQYKPGDPEFSAVITFFAFNAQMELYKSWGMVAPENPIPIYVDDPGVSDNAYFDPDNYEIHLGVGSGLPMGLARYIAYDLGVTWHENGHHVVFLQTPGQDLPGSEGGAIHESMGDVLGDLLMDFWFRLTYGTQLGHKLTSADVDADTRVIGKYALPPNGIRIQKNKNRTPKDKTGEPHDDGLISGGAKADLLVAMVMQPGADLRKALEDFGKMSLAALALVPAHKVSFQDLLKAYLTADQKLFNSANKDLIVKSFAAHGITLKNAGQRRPPVIVIK